ncbi:Camk/camk1 protein kinase, partial [Globisporangium splendens]
MSVIIKKVTDFYKKDECSKYYKLGKTLGTGSFATVKSAISKADNSRWAVKCIDKASLAAEDEEALRVEVEVLQLVQHPNIVRLREVFDCQKTFYMVMEEMSGGELFDRIVEKEKYSEKKKYLEKEASSVVKNLAGALLYCHDKGIAHRDLKPENLLYRCTDEDAEIKIADFGLAKLVKGDSLMQTACGTPGYVAPEILEGRPYGAEVDLWSLGVIAYILLCGFPPFYDENNAALFASIKSGVFDYPSPYWDCVSSSAKDLISRLLVVDPKKRYTAQNVLDHPWISEIHNVSDEALPHFTTEMKRYNARRRFRAGIMAAKAISGLSVHSVKKKSSIDAAVAVAATGEGSALPKESAETPASPTAPLPGAAASVAAPV